MEQTEQLYSELNTFSMEIIASMDAQREKSSVTDHSLNNWASEVHHPCKKFLVHCRLDWKKRQPIDINGIYRVEEGKEQEWKLNEMFARAGYKIVKGQQRFELKKHQISGKIDGTLEIDGERMPDEFKWIKEIPTEIKTVNPNYWKGTSTIEDIKKHKMFWISKIPSQLNLYLVMMKIPGGLLVLKTFGKKPRILPMILDQELLDYDLQTVKAVNEYVKLGEYPPPMPFDNIVCRMCDFNHICQPLRTTDLTEIGDLDKYELEMYLDLQKRVSEFNSLKSRLLGTKDKPGKYFGKEGFIDDIAVITKKFMKKTAKIPKEVREIYYEDYEQITTSIKRITK
ncbi:unnamed protein product [marine sediment metagenome]|uniref:PD-(D/E)XK endonuclease-like domain-containing protein n=1 Tax=marine sediment metagenome TaxID=412755 RepID=X0TZI7_9ZZZZ